MTKQTSVSGDVVTARTLPAGLPYNHTVTCSVQTEEEDELVFGYVAISQGASPPSCLYVGERKLCSQGLTVTFFEATLPFQLSLQQPAHSSLHYAWVFMEGSSEMQVTCGQGETTLPSTAAGTESPGTLRTDAVKSDLVTSHISDDGASTSVSVSSSSGGRDQLESGKEDAMHPDTGGMVVAVAVLTAGLVAALSASLAFFIWRQRQRARRAGHGTQPDQGGHIVLAELPTARPHATWENLRTEGGYARLAEPGRVSAPASDVISTGENDYDDIDEVRMDVVTEEDPTDVSRLEREGKISEESPYEVIDGDVTSTTANDYDDCDVVRMDDVTEEDPTDVRRLEREGKISEEYPYEVIAGDVTSTTANDYDDCDVGGMVDVTEENPNDVSMLEREGERVEETSGDVIEPIYLTPIP